MSGCHGVRGESDETDGQLGAARQIHVHIEDLHGVRGGRIKRNHGSGAMRHAAPNFLQIEVHKIATERSEALRRLQESV